MANPNPRAVPIGRLLVEFEPELLAALTSTGLVPEASAKQICERTLRRMGRILVPLAVLPPAQRATPVMLEILVRASRELLDAELDLYIAARGGR